MAFGQYATLQDNFNRANAGTLGANWTQYVINFTGDRVHRIASNATATNGTASSCQDWWNAGSFGPNLETHVAVVTLPGVTQDVSLVRLYARLQQIADTTTDGYTLQLVKSSVNWVYLLTRYNNGTGTNLATSSAFLFTAGDLMGLEIIGSTLRGMHFTGGSWTQILTHTDSSPITGSSTDKVGIASNEASVLDAFHAGTITDSGIPLIMMARQFVP